jgi:hypothetical protein
MEFQTGEINFPSAKDTNGPRNLSTNVTFSGNVKQAFAILTGADFGFSKNGGDHHLGQVNLEVTASTQQNSPTVAVTATLGVRDWSGNFDDPYEGIVHFAVVAELA